jgi:hypothetical protein
VVFMTNFLHSYSLFIEYPQRNSRPRADIETVHNMAASEDDGSTFIRYDGKSGFVPPRETTSGPSISRSNAFTATAAVDVARATPSHADPNTNSLSRFSQPLLQPTIPPSFPMAPKLLIIDRKFWQRRIRANTYWGLNVGSITDKLGLRRPYRTRGKQIFTGTAAQQLADAVAVLSSRLPNDAGRLVEIALDTGLLRAITEFLVATYGKRIWGKDKEGRKTELYGVGEVEAYERELRVRDAEDREM